MTHKPNAIIYTHLVLIGLILLCSFVISFIIFFISLDKYFAIYCASCVGFIAVILIIHAIYSCVGKKQKLYYFIEQRNKYKDILYDYDLLIAKGIQLKSPLYYDNNIKRYQQEINEIQAALAKSKKYQVKTEKALKKLQYKVNKL